MNTVENKIIEDKKVTVIEFQYRWDDLPGEDYIFSDENKMYKEKVERLVRDANIERTNILFKVDDLMEEENIKDTMSAQYKELEKIKKAELLNEARYKEYLVEYLGDHGSNYNQYFEDTETGEKVVFTRHIISSKKVYQEDGVFGGLSIDKYQAFYEFPIRSK